MGRDREDTFHAVPDAVVSEEVLATFVKRSIAALTIDQILVHNMITCILFPVEEAGTELVPDNLTTLYKGVENRLSAALKSPIERIVRRAAGSPQTIAKVTEAVIDNPGFIAPTYAHVKSR